VITTDLPMAVDQPIDFGLQDFCGKCRKCARECPCGAISFGDKVMFNGYEMWKPDVEACTRYRVTNPNGSACGRCMKMCPFNKKGLMQHRLALAKAELEAARLMMFQAAATFDEGGNAGGERVDGGSEIAARALDLESHHQAPGFIWIRRRLTAIEIGSQCNEAGTRQTITDVANLRHQSPPFLQHDQSGPAPGGGRSDIGAEFSVLAIELNFATCPRRRHRCLLPGKC